MPPCGRPTAPLLLALLTLLLAPAARADVPHIERPVTDLAGVLSAEDEDALAGTLVDLRDRTGVQMAVLVIDSTDGVPIDDYAQEVFDAWGGGSAERDDGALFVLAIGDRRNRLHLGYGLEPAISDAQAVELLEELVPALREAAYAYAIRQLVEGVSRLVDYLRPGEPITTAPVPLAKRFLCVPLAMALAWAAGFAWYLQRHTGKNKKKKKSKRNGAGSTDASAEPAEPAGAATPPPGLLADLRAAWARPKTRRLAYTLGLWAGAPVLLLLIFSLSGSLGFGLAYTAVWGIFAGFGTLSGFGYRKSQLGFRFQVVIALAVFVGVVVYYGPSAVLETPGLVVVVAFPVLMAFIFTVGALGGGGGGGRSWSSSGSSSSSSSSYSSGSSWSSSGSSSSSWSGGGGSSGGGGASSSW